MSVSSVSSVTNPSQNTIQSWYQQQYQDFNSLASALQSGNLSGAQIAFTAWQRDLQSIVPSNLQAAFQNQPFGSNSQANSDFQALSSALQSGDVSAAQQAFASLKQDLQSAGGVHRRHHHHHHHPQTGNKGDTDDRKQSPGSVPFAAATQSVSGSLNAQA
jgi:hypothetical protein